MTLKYESEILFDLMKRDGDDTPSDVLPYESELKEKYLEQVEGHYPKLMDYRPEWLNYNLVAHLPAEFPVETLSNVTEATVDNVVPYAYGSAILKGNTLVNLASNNYDLKSASKIENGFKLNAITSDNDHKLTFKVGAKSNTYYTYIFNSDTAFEFMTGWDATNSGAWNQPTHRAVVGLNVLRVKTEANTTNTTLLFRTTSNRVGNKDVYLTNFMLIEGDYTNLDIPYFEGMASVQMPVLKATGKNLFDKDKSTSEYYIDGTGQLVIGGSGNFINQTHFIDTKRHVSVSFSERINEAYVRLAEFDKNNKFIKRTMVGANGNLSFELSADTHYIVTCVDYNANYFIDLQIEFSSVATTYEPFKSNILTVNEPIELRGIEDVRDELNLLTGEVVERIGEVVLDGSEDWVENGFSTMRYYFCQKYVDGKPQSLKVLSDKIPTDNKSTSLSLTNLTKTGKIQLISNFSTANELKEWLSQNPITVQYQLATESIKTVDLTVTDQDGNTESIIRPIEGTMHVSTSSQTLPPLLDMSVPVEATTQNLMSFANMLEEEK